MQLKLSCTAHKTADIAGISVSISLTHTRSSRRGITHVTLSQFTAGEPLVGIQRKEWNNPHSGSIFTAKVCVRFVCQRECECDCACMRECQRECESECECECECVCVCVCVCVLFRV